MTSMSYDYREQILQYFLTGGGTQEKQSLLINVRMLKLIIITYVTIF